MRDLTKDQLLLLNTNFGEELEKQASSMVAEENEKIAELEETAASCMAYGSELAMQKIAEMEQAHQEKVAMEEEKKDFKGLEKKDEEEEEEEEEEKEEEKTASAMGNFILEGYWNTLMEKGAEYYGDKDIYIEELCKEAKLGKVEKFIKTLKSKGKHAKNVVKGNAIKGYKASKAGVTKGYKASKKHVAANKGAYGLGTGLAVGTGAGYLAGKE